MLLVLLAAVMRRSYRSTAGRRFCPWTGAQSADTRKGHPRDSEVGCNGNNAEVTSTQASAERFGSSRVHSLTRPNLVSVGTIVWLSSELMFFAGLFAMYFTARARAPHGWPPAPTELNIPYAVVFTLILVASSFTCQFGVFS